MLARKKKNNNFKPNERNVQIWEKQEKIMEKEN